MAGATVKAPSSATAGKLPSWVITVASLIVVLAFWEFFGRKINPIFGSYPSAIALAFWKLLQTGELLKATWLSLQAFLAGYLLAASVGVPLGLFIGRSRILEAAIGVYIIGGYAMPLVALVPLLVLWFGLGFASF